MDRLKVSRELASRYLNDGFSGGEKKRVEILQMAMLKPKIAVLDETDSGLDIDALRIVAGGVKELVGPEMGALVITHYQRILNYVTPDFVHVFIDGRIVEEGGPSSRTSSRPRATRRYREVLQSHDARPRPTSSRESARSTSTASPTPTRRRTTSSSRAAASTTRSSRRSPRTRTSRTGCGSSGTSRSTTSSRGRCRQWGGDLDADRLREHLLLHQADREAGGLVGGPARRDPRHVGQARHPRGGEEVPRRRRRAVRVRGRLPQAPGGPREAGRDLPRHGLRPARARGARQAVLRDDHPAERQQVRGAELARSGRAARSSTCRRA